MTPNQRNQTSKFLSLILRHAPETIGITLDDAGWVDVFALLTALDRHGKSLSRQDLEEIVATSDKKRFAFSEDGTRIRANQGHSLEVDLQLAPIQPPELLYHGTADRFLDSIRIGGLQKMSRQHVHLSPDTATASKVGVRHGRLVLLTIRAGAMHAAGHAFFRSANGVWLTDRVPTEFIDFPTT